MTASTTARPTIGRSRSAAPIVPARGPSGHGARLPAAYRRPLAAVVRVAPATRQLKRIRKVARATPEVVDAHRVTGEDRFFLELHLRSSDDLEGILADPLLALGEPPAAAAP